jgi:hypothetical protein
VGEDGNPGLWHLMPSFVSGAAALLTALAGLLRVLHQMGYLAARAPFVPPAAAQAPARIEGGATGPLSQTPSTGQPHQALDKGSPAGVEGAWRDRGSNCHLIQQVGNKLVVTSYKARGAQVRVIGGGTVKGRWVHLKLNNRNPFSPAFDFFLSDDGRELSGKMHYQLQTHPALWRYVGSTCASVNAAE